MDVILDVCDDLFLDKVYGNSIPRDDILRQSASLLFLVTLGGIALYLLTAAISYHFVFDKRVMEHKRFLKNQVWLEIKYACSQIPGMSLLTCPLFLLEVRGHSQLYHNVSDYGVPYLILSCFMFLMFIDCGIYWVHRGLHIPYIYKNVHKPHHKWLVPTPFASHAFHFLDGFAQSSPYHIAAFLFPIHKWAYLGLFIFVNVWTVSIHDGVNSIPDWLQEYINGSAHHADHHLYYNYNHGQFFTLWDRIGGTHRNPEPHKISILDKDLMDNETPDCDRGEIKQYFAKEE
eukprot:comp20962_c0_seq1/m.28048 comp20962_c0_seq1/g.28048  ORF comp20962_c0_seq1/g.28048 comp20962_c0_seq1/m.28048 type:complete len:288 (-) comp20962_c0_seq1:620-1483(-)